MNGKVVQILVPLAVAIAAAVVLWSWLGPRPSPEQLREPESQPAGAEPQGTTSPTTFRGNLKVLSTSAPASAPGSWPGFRGANRDGVSAEETPLARSWPAAGPPTLWTVDVGEGYAAPAVLNGRVYLLDYDSSKGEDVLRCLSLADGTELWRYGYPVKVKRNHGMSRTVPAVTDKYVVSLGPKCHVLCLDARSGELKWAKDLTSQYGTTVPLWYAGQCPLIDGDRVILAPSGPHALLVALDAETGKELWPAATPNPNGWVMTHVSILPMTFDGKKMYVYCGSGGVAGVDAATGELLWQTDAWRISTATVPTPVDVGGGEIFLSGGYNAGSMMLQLKSEGGKIVPVVLFRLDAKVFGATQQTPILYEGHLYGVRPSGELVCLSLEGKILWSSKSEKFGLGPFVIAGGMIYAMNDEGVLSLVAARPDKFELLAKAKVLSGGESWGPLAIAGGKLLVRDMKKMACLDVAAK